MPYLKHYIILTSVLTILSAVVFNVFLPEKVTFANAFMLTNMAKLFVYLVVFLSLYFLSGKNTAFAVDFLAVYAVFLIVDTAVLLKIFKE